MAEGSVLPRRSFPPRTSTAAVESDHPRVSRSGVERPLRKPRRGDSGSGSGLTGPAECRHPNNRVDLLPVAEVRAPDPSARVVPLRPGRRGPDGWRSYQGRLPYDRAIEAYTVHVVPRDPGSAMPLDLALIAWQR